jgi:hypothetical protein
LKYVTLENGLAREKGGFDDCAEADSKPKVLAERMFAPNQSGPNQFAPDGFGQNRSPVVGENGDLRETIMP